MVTRSNLERSTTSVKLQKWQRPRPCWCTGYWFPHRKGGGACDHSRTRDIHLAIRTKDPEAIEDARLAFILKYPRPARRARRVRSEKEH